MIIKELRASFGKLKGTLQLQEGYNELYLPNEAGKSTWSAFLVAMLYGIDTSERASAQNQGLPAKERYRPWDGSPMEGAVELEWQGRSITIERSTQGRMPMGKFTAYETHSGTPIPELTGENCGRILCGVERSVFERSAFIRQLGLAVSKDAALEKRMNALVTTGEEEGLSASQLEKELKNRRTKLIGRAGRIPKSSAQLEEVEQRLQEIHRLRAETMGLSAQKESQTQKLQAAQAQLDRLEAARQAQKRAGLADLEVKLQQQEALCKELEEAVRSLPAEEALHSLQKQLEQKESALETAKLDAAFFSGAVERPEAVRGFENCSAAEALPQAERDSREIRRLLALRPKKLYLPMILFALCLAAGAVLAFFLGTAGWAVLGLGALGLAVCLILYAKSAAGAKQARQKAAALLARYGAADAEALLPLAREHCARMEGYERLSAQNSSARAQLLAEEAQAREELEALLQQIRSFAPQCSTAAQCRSAVAEGLQTHEKLQSQRRLTDYLRQQYRSLKPVLDTLPAAREDPEALAFDEAKLQYEKRSAASRLEELSSRLDHIGGALSAMDDPMALEARAEQLREQIDRDTLSLEVIDIALAALQEADSSLRSRFSPRITAEAGKLLAALTGEKYSSLLLNPDLQLSVRESGGAVSRPAAAMSCGTADQMYLALRLAMSHQLLPGNVPLILDDALVNFDDERAKAAIGLLKQEAETRQVILFTCRSLPQ